jgi:hypothetical protein
MRNTARQGFVRDACNGVSQQESSKKIMYHPQSGWFDEGPQRGPAMI